MNWVTEISAIVTAVATIFLAIFAKRELGKISSNAEAEFLYKFKTDFFTKNEQELIEAIDGNQLIYDESSGVFTLKNDKAVKLNTYQVDDVLLGHLEDIGQFERLGFLSIDVVYDMFSWYIERTFQNPEIKKYIDLERNAEDGEDIYQDFQSIFKKVKSYGKAKRAGKSIIIWKIKWWAKNRFCKSIE
jgi:hypothetical protein